MHQPRPISAADDTRGLSGRCATRCIATTRTTPHADLAGPVSPLNRSGCSDRTRGRDGSGDTGLFRPARRRVRGLLTFGGGVHYCLGARLARLELAEALTVITRLVPNPHRAGPAPWKPLLGITGPTTLPIEFDAGH
jgi:hypothetical protein